MFVAGCEMLPDFTPRQAAEQDAFAADFRAASPDFQSEHGYAASKYKDDVLKLASKYVGHTFRLPVADARDAVQGQRQRARRAQRMERRPQRPAGRRLLGPLRQHLQRTAT